jgi:hypothetical protein
MSHWHWLLICLMCCFPSSVGQNLTFWTFREKHSHPKGQNCQTGKIFRGDCSEKQFKRTWSPRGQHPPNFSEEQVPFSYTRQFKWGDFSRFKWSKLCQTFKSNQSQEILKRGSYACDLIFKPSRLLAKGKFMSLAKVFCLNKGSITFNHI